MQQQLCPARHVLATRGQAASYAAAAQRTPQEPAELACCEGRPYNYGWRMAWGVSAHIGCGGVAANGQRYLRTLGGGTRHGKTLSVSVPHGIVR